MPHAAILGGGVNGLATGVALRERFPDMQVDIVAELTGDETTSRGAGGLWKPFSLGISCELQWQFSRFADI